MVRILKRNKFMLIVIVVEILFFWLIFYSGVVFPIINLSSEEYKKAFTSFPRDYTQKMIWYLLHVPSSFIVENCFSDYEILQSLSIIQTCFLAYLIKRKK